MKLPSYLSVSRHGVFYLRLQSNGVDQRVSLKTKDPSVAAIAAYRFGAKILAMKKKLPSMKFANAEEVLEQENFDLKIKQFEIHSRAYQRIKALEDLAEEDKIFQLMLSNRPDLANIAGNTAPTTTKISDDHEKSISILDALEEYKIFLANSKQAEKSKRMALSVLDDFAKLVGKDFKMHDISDVIIEEKWLQTRLLKVKDTTAKRDFTFIRGFINWASDKKRQYCNQKIELTVQAEESDHWEYFDATDLNALFSNLPEKSREPWQFWVPLLGLYFGARISEIASIKTEYFKNKSGIDYVHLAGTKTDASPRDIPIHQDLLDIGLLKYVNYRRVHNKEMLFDFTNNSQNGFGAKPSKWFSRFKKDCGINHENKVFASFRHTIVDLLNQKSVDNKANCQYVGHSISNTVNNRVYGRNALSLQKMKADVVDKIDFYEYCGWQPDLNSLKEVVAKFIF